MNNPKLLGARGAALFILSGLFLNTWDAFAAGEATHYWVTVKKIEFRNLSGQWVTAMEPNKAIDLVDPESKFSFQNGGKIPPGDYEIFKITLSETFKVSGSDGEKKTKTGGEIVVGGTASKASDLPGEITSLQERSPTLSKDTEGEMTVHVNLDHEDRDDIIEIYGKRPFPKPLTIKANSKIVVALVFNLKETIHFAWKDSVAPGLPAADVIYFLPSRRVEDVSVKSDFRTAYTSSDDIEMVF